MPQTILYQDPEELLALFCRANSAVVPLAVAENVLLFEKYLKPIFEGGCSTGVEDVKYQANYGEDDLNGEIGAFLSRSLGLTPTLTSKHISSFAGTRCAIDVLGQALFAGYGGRPGGSSVMIPSPRWHGFAWTFEARLGGAIIDVPLTSANNFELTLAALEAAYSAASPKPRALLLTQPENPLGIHYKQDFLKSVSKWVLEETEMDLISDEIYAHCRLKKPEGPEFTSALALPLALKYPDRVHVVWGFAKDFGLSGFRVGALVSRSEKLHGVVRPVTRAGFSPMTSSNRWFLRKLFRQQGTVDRLMGTVLPNTLQDSFQEASEALGKNGIPRFGRTHSALFFWLDLRRWLDRRIPPVTCPGDPDQPFGDPREQALERYLRCGWQVSLLRGQVLAAQEPGFFRLCYSAVDKATLLAAINRIGLALKAISA